MKTSSQSSALSTLVLLIRMTCAAAQGTVTLNLATSNDETASSISVPFNTLFDASSSPRGVSIQVSTGSNVPVSQDQILCQCFSDQAGTKLLGETFNNVFPGTRISQEPVKIGSIFCSDAGGVKKMASAGSGTGKGTGSSSPNAQVQTTSPAAVAAPTMATSSAMSATVAAMPTAASVPQANSNAQSPASSSAGDTPVAIIKFSHSTDPSDDSASQISVPVDSSTTTLGNKRAASATIVTTSGLSQESTGDVLCQVFADLKAAEPIAAGFRVEQTMSFGGIKLETLGAVGCAMVGSKGFGGVLGLVGV
ncbi:MAG: hypothetical protein Q9218_003628 [Villophora microphyllina]